MAAGHYRHGRVAHRILGGRLVAPVSGGPRRLGRGGRADARHHRDHRRVPATRSQPGGADVFDMNLADLLIHTTATQPDRAAVRLGDATTSYTDLADASARVAGLLADR